MRLRELRVEQQPEFMIIPMIDIIFFLLVFFMMSTLYMVEQRTLPVNLPQAAAARQDNSRNIAISLLADGRVAFEQEEMPLALLGKRIQGEVAARPDNSFILRADKDVRYESVIAVLDEIKLAGARKVSLANEGKAR